MSMLVFHMSMLVTHMSMLVTHMSMLVTHMPMLVIWELGLYIQVPATVDVEILVWENTEWI